MQPKIIRVPAHAGWQWFKLGWAVFRRHPLLFALPSGLWLLGRQLPDKPPLANFLTPFLTMALTLAVMAAAARSIEGQRSGPALPLAFGPGRKLLRALLIPGLLLLIAELGLGALCAASSSVMVHMPDSGLLAIPLHLALSLWWWLLGLVPATLLWHVPGLVYWHGLPPLTAALLSVKACLRNWQAGLRLGLAWSGLALVLLFCLVVLKGFAPTLGDWLLDAAMLIPWVVLMLSNFFCFRDCFSTPSAPPSVPTRTFADPSLAP